VEKQDRLGGLLNDLNLVLPTHEPPSILVNDLTTRLESNPKVKIHTLSEVKKVEGYVGNYIVTLSDNGTESKINAGVIVVAVGARVLKPEGLLNYDGEKVITHLELEAMLKKGGSQPKNVVIVQCVGSVRRAHILLPHLLHDRGQERHTPQRGRTRNQCNDSLP
jgi:heterodisulfide reductase subunit A